MGGAAQSHITVHKTAVFKLHNPSRRKRAMLDYALRANHLAYSKALNAISPRIPEIVAAERAAREADRDLPPAERRKQSAIRKVDRLRELSSSIYKIINPLPICGASKAPRSIPGSIIGQIESHLELHDVQESVGVPSAERVHPLPNAYEASLDRLGRATTLEEENAARDDLFCETKDRRLRPLLLSRNNVAGGFLLLRDSDSARRFVWLNLVPKTSRFARLTKPELREGSSRNPRNMVNLRTGEIVSFKSKTGCLFPVEFGRDFHNEEFLEKGSPLSAKLMKRGDDYEVHVTFEFNAPKIQPRSYLGVDRGIYNLASFAVIDTAGTIIERKNLDGRQLRFVQKQLERRQRQAQKRGRRYTGRAKRHAADEAVHITANEIVAAAARERSQVILENLGGITNRGGKRPRSNFNRLLNRAQYEKLRKVLEYKLALAGLPPAKEVHPGYTSQACPVCGTIDKANRLKVPTDDGFKMDVFRCVQCGFTDDADLNAARVISLKRLWRESLSPALRVAPFAQVPEPKNFPSYLRICAERRGERACDRKVGTFGRAGLDGQCEGGEVPPGAVSDGNAVEPRSGSNTPASENSATTPSPVSPSDENSHAISRLKPSVPDG